MSDTEVDIERLRKEINYYKKRVEELAGENLKMDYSISGLRHELKQKKLGFALLSELQQTIGSDQQISSIFAMSIHGINSQLGMDKTVVMVPAGTENQYRPSQCLGFNKDEEAELKEHVLEFPPEFAAGTGLLVVNKATEATPLIERIRTLFDLPYFICLGIVVDGTCVGVLMSGRIREAKPLYPPLDQGDVDTFQSIAGLISSFIRNMRVAALEEMDRMKTDFFANISHEFRTPITLTLGPLEGLMAGRYGALPEKAIPQVEVMHRNQARLLGLINQILDLAKLESGGMTLEASLNPAMNRFVRERADQFQSMAEKRGLELRVSLDAAVDGAEVYIDPEKMDKVVFNLLSNAHKFTRSGFVAVSTAIESGQFVLTVQDSGVGIRPDQVIHIFDRFKQADGSASREYAGTGIGLSLVKELVELHGGRITVHSEYGKGTRFKVTIPLGKEHLDPAFIIEASEEDDASRANSARVVDIREGVAQADELEDLQAINARTLKELKSARPTILYADDNPDLRRYVYDILSEHYNVFLAENGKAGLDLAMQQNLDLILSDLMMPVMTGNQFLKCVREEVKLQGVPFVLLTAKSGSDSRIEGLEGGADDYLNKPFSEPELLARIRNLIRLREQHVRIKRELQAARAIQQSLLPSEDWKHDKVTLEALYNPCEELSGDFYDYIESGEWVYFYVADVTSHGTASAQVTYLIKGLFRDLVQGSSSLEVSELLARAAAKYVSFNLEYSVGLQVARFHKELKVVEYVMSNAPKAARVSGGKGEVFKVEPGIVIDRMNENYGPENFKVASTVLAPGDSVFFFTDGVYEFEHVEKGTPFTYARFLKLLPEMAGANWKEQLFEELSSRRGSSSFGDDLTILRLRWSP